jgi:uncharacterized protein (TIGR02598 family)
MMLRLPSNTASRFPNGAATARRSGFTLVEVVLALGLFGFAVVAMLGVIPLCLQSAKKSIDTTRQSEIIEYISGNLEQKMFSNLSSPQELKWTFDYEGNPTTEISRIYYTVTANAGGTFTLPGTSSASSEIFRVTLTISSPAGLKKAALSVANMGK